MRSRALAVHLRRAISRSHPAQFAAVPQFRQPCGGAHLVFLGHAVSTENLRAFIRDQTYAWLALIQQLENAFVREVIDQDIRELRFWLIPISITAAIAAIAASLLRRLARIKFSFKFSYQLLFVYPRSTQCFLINGTLALATFSNRHHRQRKRMASPIDLDIG